MKLKTLLSVGAAGAVLPVAALVPATFVRTVEKSQQPSAKPAKPLHNAQEDLDATKWTDAIGKLKETERMSGKTPYDQHVINDFLGGDE